MRIRRREVTKRMSADSHILLPGHHVGQAQFIADAMHRNAGGSGSLGDADAGEFMSKRRVIIDDERLHVYEDGIWVALSPTEVRGIITSIDGMHAAGKPILMSSRDVSGILQCMMHIEELQAPNFFSEATEGAALSDCYLKVERTGSSCSIAAVEHSPEYRCAFSLNASSTTDDPAEFIRFLQTCYEGDADRSEKIMALQEFIGLTLVGMAHKISDARAILLQGQTMSGKSTIIEVIEELLPPGVITNMAPQEWIHTSQTNSTDFKMSQLRNARLNSLGELGDLRQLTSAENFKKIVTGDALSVRRSGKDGETIRVGAGIIMATNHSWSSPSRRVRSIRKENTHIETQ